ncbi:DUF192 domain-containing protein [Alcaligenaceae bacterium A4P071]|nr:DUF192 domain-containing protein [Alcaligenaceae bacterium B3P038]MDQ2151555.1 DUF192 domain-containing protein [Alcaligenaceae bacterium C4P045]MDQ2187961.1 DUF192 domain-containing protein [Alcaligenaceae bacterium A4P071]
MRRLEFLRPIALAALAALSIASPSAAHAEPPVLPITELSAGIHVIRAEVANTPDKRSTGLMFRQALAPNHGMLFVFDEPDRQCFWMRNTLLPLSIAFIEDDGTIVNIENMAPQTEDAHCSRKAVRYALEMDQGWFAARGITHNQKVEGLP